MRRSCVLVVMLAACGHDEPFAVEAPGAPAAAPAPKVDPIVKGVPHGGHIEQVAVTEQGDAALTFDNVGGVRLWPALDASRTPVPLSALAPKELSLAHAGNDLLAAILDEAGMVRVLRLGRDGSVRGRVQLPGEVAYAQAIALDEGVLVRSEDQTVEWFSPDGESRGRVVADPAQRVQTIAARKGQAVAVIKNGSRYELRWLLTLGGTLMWGARVDLPATVKGDMFALSPSHRRFALVDHTSTLMVYELGLRPERVGPTQSTFGEAPIGFTDDDHVAVMATSMQWWVMPANKTPTHDPWAVAAPSHMPVPSSSISHRGTVADGIAVTGFGAALAIVTTEHVKYLGYREHGVGNLGAIGNSLWVTMTGSRILWLDDKLAVRREIELHKSDTDPWVYGTPIGEHHVIAQGSQGGNYTVELIDLDKPLDKVKIGSYVGLNRIDYTRESGLLAISAGNKLHRFELDLATNTVTALAPLRTKGASVTQVILLDPARANGIVAVTVGWNSDWDDDYTLYVYREKGTPRKVKPFRGRIIDIQEDGTMYVHAGTELQVLHGEKKVASRKAEPLGAPIAINSDASRFALMRGNDVVMQDGQGAELWRKPMWGTQQMVFTSDDKNLAVRANGGLLLLDATSGERTAMECGWSFELMSRPPTTNALAAAPVCEDPML